MNAIPRARITFVAAPPDGRWGTSGGAAYERCLATALSDRFQVRPLGLDVRRSRSVAHGMGLLARLMLLRGNSDVWLRDQYAVATLPFDRTSGRQVALVHHIDNGMLPHRLAHRVIDRMMWRGLRQCDLVVTVSRFWQDRLKAAGCRNVEVIYNPVEVRTAPPEAVQAFRARHGLTGKPIIYIGQCLRLKGAVEVYEALKDMDVTLVTSGRADVSLPVVHLDVPHEEYLLLLQASSVVVTMSLFLEGWNRTAHEAMLCGTPVVGSGTGGMRELLEGGGQIVCPTFRELPAAVSRAMGSDALAASGREFAGRFTYRRFQTSWFSVLDALR